MRISTVHCELHRFATLTENRIKIMLLHNQVCNCLAVHQEKSLQVCVLISREEWKLQMFDRILYSVRRRQYCMLG